MLELENLLISLFSAMTAHLPEGIQVTLSAEKKVEKSRRDKKYEMKPFPAFYVRTIPHRKWSHGDGSLRKGGKNRFGVSRGGNIFQRVELGACHHAATGVSFRLGQIHSTNWLTQLQLPSKANPRVRRTDQTDYRGQSPEVLRLSTSEVNELTL